MQLGKPCEYAYFKPALVKIGKALLQDCKAGEQREKVYPAELTLTNGKDQTCFICALKQR